MGKAEPLEEGNKHLCVGNILRDTEEEITRSVREAAGNQIWLEQLQILGTPSEFGPKPLGKLFNTHICGG